MSTNIYYNPEKFGLTIVKDYENGGGYEFDIIVVWKTRDGRYLIGNDSGCSCPTPFEDFGIDDLTEVHSLADVAEFARGVWVQDWMVDRYRDEGNTAVVNLLGGLVLA